MGVVQKVERALSMPEVGGSMPRTSTKFLLVLPYAPEKLSWREPMVSLNMNSTPPMSNQNQPFDEMLIHRRLTIIFTNKNLENYT